MKLKKIFIGLLFGFGMMVNALNALTIDPNTIVGKTLYFTDVTGTIGERTYGNDGNYTGELTFNDGSILDVNGTYTIVDDTLTLQRTSQPSDTMVLVYLSEEGNVKSFEKSINNGPELLTYVFSTEVDRDDAIADPDMDGFTNLDETIANTDPSDYNDNPFTATFIDKTTYFASTTGASGERTYNNDGNYTGSISFLDGSSIDVNGTYSISGKVITLHRATGTVLVLTYLTEDEGAIIFGVSIDGAEETLSYVFRTIEERDSVRDFDDDGMNDEYEILYGLDPTNPDDAGLDLDVDGFTNLEEYEGDTNATDSSDNPLTVALINKTTYFINTGGSIGDRNYAEDGNYTGNILLSNGTELALSGTFVIEGKVLTLTRSNGLKTVLTYLSTDEGVSRFTTIFDEGAETTSYIFDTEEARNNSDIDADGFSYSEEFQAGTDFADASDNPLTVALINKTTYFLNSTGSIGDRTYTDDGNYTGTLTLSGGTPFPVEGTFTIEGKVVTLTRSGGTIVIVLTYQSTENGVTTFTTTVNGGAESTSYIFDTEEARNNSDIDADGFSYSEEFQAGTDFADANDNPLTVALINKMTYFLNSTGTIGNRNYVDDGTYTGTLFLTNGTELPVFGTFVIDGKVLTLTRSNDLKTVLTYLSTDEGVSSFTTVFNGEEETTSLIYDIKEERDAAIPTSGLNPSVIMYLLN